MDMNNVNIEEIVKQVLSGMTGNAPAAAPAAIAASEAAYASGGRYLFAKKPPISIFCFEIVVVPINNKAQPMMPHKANNLIFFITRELFFFNEFINIIYSHE